MDAPLIRTRDLKKVYRIGTDKDRAEGRGSIIHALDGVSVDIAAGEFTAVMGPSGSGKSTFMHMLGCLDRPTSGEYVLGGRKVSELEGDELAEVRNRNIGFVFQTFNLLARTAAVENVELPLVYAGVPSAERRVRALEMLAKVGLAERANHHPGHVLGHRRTMSPGDSVPTERSMASSSASTAMASTCAGDASTPWLVGAVAKTMSPSNTVPTGVMRR